jgi:hypoxanthine-DNA glycosylase
MSQVLDVDLVNLQYQSRLNVLLEHRVGLWDVIADAVREGSLDSKIRQHQGNDLATFVAENPSITTIAFNGKTASKLGRKQIAPILHQIKIFDLPSSSPAHTMSVEKKIKSWILLRSRLSGAI